jgi:hypothetical protein
LYASILLHRHWGVIKQARRMLVELQTVEGTDLGLEDLFDGSSLGRHVVVVVVVISGVYFYWSSSEFPIGRPKPQQGVAGFISFIYFWCCAEPLNESVSMLKRE